MDDMSDGRIKQDASAGAVITRMIAGTGLRNQSELARELGVRRAAVTDAKRRGTVPAQWLLTLCRERGLNPVWLENGTGPMSLYSTVSVSGPSFDRLPAAGEIAVVPLVRARPAAGTGSLETGAEAEALVPFAYEDLRRRGNATAMRLMRVTGDSMAPTLMDGDTIMVDTAAVEPRAGRIFAVRIDDEILVKRMDRRPGRLVLLSDNRALYPPVEVDLNEGVDAAVIGMVVWLGREMG